MFGPIRDTVAGEANPGKPVFLEADGDVAGEAET